MPYRRTTTIAALALLAITASTASLAPRAWSQDADDAARIDDELAGTERRALQQATENDERRARIDELRSELAGLDRGLELCLLDLARAGIDPAAIHGAVATAAARLDEARTELRIVETRQAAVEEGLARLTVEIDVRIDGDDVVKAGARALEEQQSFLEKLPEMIKDWEWSPEYHEQKTKVLDLRIALSDRRATLAESFGAATVRRLQSDLIDIDIRFRELRTTIQAMEERWLRMEVALVEYEATQFELHRQRTRVIAELGGLINFSGGGSGFGGG